MEDFTPDRVRDETDNLIDEMNKEIQAERKKEEVKEKNV